MRQRKYGRAARPALPVVGGGVFGLESLEARWLLASDLAGVQLLLTPNGQRVEVRQWLAAHEQAAGGVADPVVFKLLSAETRGAGPDGYVGLTAPKWSEFVHQPDGRLGVTFTGTETPYLGAAFASDAGHELGWLYEGEPGEAQTLSFLHELPTSASIESLDGSWSYTAFAIPTSGSAQGTSVEGAYGVFTIEGGTGEFTYSGNLVEGTTEGSGTIVSLDDNGLGMVSGAQYFSVSLDGDVMTIVDLSYGDGLVYIALAVRRDAGVTEAEVVGEYRFSAAYAGGAASRRGADLLAFESVYLKLNDDNTFAAYDLADWDEGVETEVHHGQWSLAGDNHSVLLAVEDMSESHILSFSDNPDVFLELRVTHENGPSVALGQGLRVTAVDGGGGGGGEEDDFGADDDGSGDELIDPADVPLPRLVFPARAPTGRQAVWEYGRDLGWYYSKLGLRSDTPGMIGELVTWYDSDSKQYKAAAAAEEGMILWTRDEATATYTKSNLTDEVGEEAELPTAPVTRIELETGETVLLSLNSEGDVIAYVAAGSPYVVNLSRDEIRGEDKTVPALTGTLTGGVTAWGTVIIAGLDAEGMVWTLWFSQQAQEDRWQASALSQIAGADPVAGGLSIYFTSWNGINIAALNDRGESQVLWWVPGFKGVWEVSNLTTLFDGPEYKAGSMTTYTTPWDALTIVGITTDGRMVAYWWTPAMDEWQIADFSALLPTQQPRVVRGPIHMELRDNSNIWLFGRDAEGNMVRVFWSRSGDRWTSSLITTEAQQF